MAVDVEKIRNVAVVGQGGVGKTSVADALVFLGHGEPKLGKVDEGSSAFDTEPEEIRHKVSLTASLHAITSGSHDVTIVDTPGFANFLGEARNALRAVDGAVLVLPSDGHVKVESERLVGWLGEEDLAAVGFVPRVDREVLDVVALCERLSVALGRTLVPIVVPIGGGADLGGLVDVLSGSGLAFDANGKASTRPIPDELVSVVTRARERLVEAIAETDDRLLETYLEEGELGEAEVREGLRSATVGRQLIPVLCGAAPSLFGVARLLDAILELLPSPVERPSVIGTDPRSGDAIERRCDPAEPMSAFVFKTIADPYAGKLSVLRVCSGTLSADTTATNATSEGAERIGHLFRIEGKRHTDVPAAVAGQIVAAPKLKTTSSGDTLADEKAPIRFPTLAEVAPAISFAIEPKTKGDEEKAQQALHRMLEEDLSLRVHRDPQTREILLSGAGQQHVEIVVEKLARKFGVEVELKAPKVPYRETIKARSKAQGKYKKQSGGRGQYGDCWLEIEPLARGAGFEFVDKIVGGVIPRGFIPAVEKGVREAMEKGVLAGFPMEDVRVTVVDGSHHSVDSSEMAFKIAGSMGFKNAVADARAIVLEPLMKLTVLTPEDAVGDVISDLNGRRGRVSGVEPKANAQEIRAEVPMAEMLRYAPDLRSLTSGRGQFEMEMSRYEEVPAHLAEKVIAAAKAAE